MPCYSPLLAWQADSGEILFEQRGALRRELQLPCGRCIGCRLERSRQWAMRCMHEASLFTSNSFITLTYDESHCPVSLIYSDFQLFMKRLRKQLGKCRFYMCGEYGETNFRPHFHALLFGVGFPDRKVLTSSLYTSATLERLWSERGKSIGFSTVGDVTFDSAAYVARYVLKKVSGDNAEHYSRVDPLTGEVVPVQPEFCRMSLRPGIGADWIKRFRSDVYGYDRDGVVVNGHRSKPPRFYDQVLLRDAPLIKEHIDFMRTQDALARSADGTEARLAVREKVARAALKNKLRNVEF